MRKVAKVAASPPVEMAVRISARRVGVRIKRGWGASEEGGGGKGRVQLAREIRRHARRNPKAEICISKKFGCVKLSLVKPPSPEPWRTKYLFGIAIPKAVRHEAK